jgi:hypothetical protein
LGSFSFDSYTTSICFEGRGFSRVVIGDKENATLVAERIFPGEYYSPFDAANRQTLRYANWRVLRPVAQNICSADEFLEHGPFGGTIASQFVSDNDPRFAFGTNK